MIFGLLLAGGLGTRTKSVIPKQFTLSKPINGDTSATNDIHSQTVLELATMNLFQSRCDIVVICVPPLHLDFVNNMYHLQQQTQTEHNKQKIKVISGGTERIDSLKIGIKFILQTYQPSYVLQIFDSQNNQKKINNCDNTYNTDNTNTNNNNNNILVIHDAARPYVPPSDIQRLIDEFTTPESYRYIQYITPLTGGLIYIPSTTNISTNTPNITSNNVTQPENNENKVLNRNEYYELVTPLGIKFSLLLEILENHEFPSEFITILQNMGEKYKLIIPDDPGLFRKLTWPSDVELEHYIHKKHGIHHSPI